MNIRHLASGLSISGHIHPEQLSEIKNSGYRAILCINGCVPENANEF